MSPKSTLTIVNDIAMLSQYDLNSVDFFLSKWLALLYTVGGTQLKLGGDESAAAYITHFLYQGIHQSHPGVFVFLAQ